MHQSQIPIEVRPEEVARKQTLGGAIELCAELGGYALDKSLQTELKVDKAQFSRWLSGQEGVIWPKLENLMDVCGNDAPLLWMLYQRGYDLHSLRKRKSEIERELEAERAARKELEDKVRFLAQVVQGKVA